MYKNYCLLCYHRYLDLTTTTTLNYCHKPQQLSEADLKICFVECDGFNQQEIKIHRRRISCLDATSKLQQSHSCLGMATGRVE
jgi:hypothetical protein